MLVASQQNLPPVAGLRTTLMKDCLNAGPQHAALCAISSDFMLSQQSATTQWRHRTMFGRESCLLGGCQLMPHAGSAANYEDTRQLQDRMLSETPRQPSTLLAVGGMICGYRKLWLAGAV